MRFARTPSGFKILLSKSAQSTLDGASDSATRLPEVWAAICERLRFTAHREGTMLSNHRQLMKFPGDPAFKIPTIALTYVVVGDEVRVEKIMVVV